jgi:cytoplasmic iron level regulating protein YaaA (DUF328/UPF0246 family)
MAYLITCCGSKIRPTQLLQGNIDSLYRDDVLREYRNELIANSGIQLDWSKTLPAYKLYSGKIYSKVSQQNWTKPCVEIKILSALFGWIKHTDLIPYYDLKIDQKKGALNNPPYVFWKESGLLLDMIDSDDVDLLSGTYKKAFNGIIPAQIPNDFVYKDWGDCVGHWLEAELNRINCDG